MNRFHIVARTSKWTVTTDKFDTAAQAHEAVVPLVAAQMKLPLDEVGDVLAVLEMKGMLDETMFLDDVEVYAGDYL